MHILITGNPRDGFTHVGPFAAPGDAIDYAELVDIGADWWVVELVEPTDSND